METGRAGKTRDGVSSFAIKPDKFTRNGEELNSSVLCRGNIR
jgi:hypothetical protein